jgi:DNA-binding transcriptional ArsR family regulator
MLMDLIRQLRDAGLSAQSLPEPSGSDNGADMLLEVGEGDRKWIFVVQVKQRSPYPNEVADLESHRKQLEPKGEPLLVVPFVTEGTGERLAEAGWSWADLEGNLHLRAAGLLVDRRRPRTRQVQPKTIPQGTGGLAIIRALIGFMEGEAEPLDATSLANQAGVTQPRASQVLGRLRELGLVDKVEGRWWPDREKLLDRFLDEYRGPGGSEHYFYSLSEPTEVAVAVTSGSELDPRELRNPIVVSGDVAADLMASWMRPRVVVLYASEEVPTDASKLTPAIGRDDANVILRFPQDQSIFPRRRPSTASIGSHEIPLADTTQIIWDLQHLGGSDRLEAAGELRKWLLNR